MRYYLLGSLFTILSSNALAQDVLMLTDIHFTPYNLCTTSPCPLLTNLLNSDISKWDKILESDSKVGYQIETSNKLLVDSLKQIKTTAKVNSTFVTGDMLAHHFDDNYYKYIESKYHNQQDFTRFSIKSTLYVLSQIESYTNQSKIYFTIGNNDTDTVDYQVPTQSYNLSLARFLTKSTHNKQSLDFKNDGYYSIDFNQHTKLISLNSNVLSRSKTNQKIANQQLTWLTRELHNAQKHKQNVIILQHIPYSVDTYKTSKTGQVIFNLNQDLQAKYLKVLDKYSERINFILSGHFHQDYIQLLPTKKPIPVFSSLALNSYFGNNPGFKLFILNNNSQVEDYRQYYADLTRSTQYKLEYSFAKTYSGLSTESKINSIQYTGDEATKYIKYYNGSNQLIPQPINNQWEIYYCAIHNIEINSYNKCLKTH